MYEFSSIDSTQTFIKNKLLENDIDEGTIALTDHQSAGKGTQGRTWFSLPKPQLMFSMLLNVPIPPQKLPLLNLVSAVVLADVLSEFGIVIGIKWPNDIYIGSKKVAGILSELVVHDKNPYVIQGLGINMEAESSDFPEDLRNKMTTLSQHAKSKIDRFELLENFLIRLEMCLFEDHLANLIRFTQEGFQKYWMYRGQEIEIQVANQILRGVANEIDANGSLVLCTNFSQDLRKIVSGTILTAASIDKPAKNA